MALEDTSAECRQLKVELSHAKRRMGVLKGERDQHASRSRSLEQALADAGEKKMEAIRYCCTRLASMFVGVGHDRGMPGGMICVTTVGTCCIVAVGSRLCL